ncbi:MAG: CAP domain-containing protein [Mycolicibacterium sp.]|nr:CAP domain-containing protein [Mycolicibacterium sp.]
MMPTMTTPRRALVVSSLLAVAAGMVAMPTARADNSRLNNTVFGNIYTAQKQNGCPTDPRLDGRLVDAARRQTVDLLNNHDINGDVGTDGSTPQDRAQAAGFTGRVAETVAINQSIAINGIDILGQWWWDPPSRAAMQDCSHTAIGVWSENSLDRSVVVAVYGAPA